MIKVIEKRRSVRDFSKTEFTKAELEKLYSLLQDMPKLCSDDGLFAKYYSNGSELVKKLEGVAGYSGKMISSPYYIAILAKKDEDKIKAAGYAAEWLALELSALEIGSCWISLNNNEEKINQILEIKEPYSIKALLAVGHPEKPSFLSSIFQNKTTRTGAQSVEVKEDVKNDKLSIQDIVFEGEFGKKPDLDELEQHGYLDAFSYLRFAPSSLNRQPWRFVVLNEGILLCVDMGEGYEDRKLALIEAGIAMLYFKTAMAGNGFNGFWDMEAGKEVNVPEHYLKAGVFKPSY